MNDDILKAFSKTLNAMQITGNDINEYLYQLQFPELDFNIREQLSGDGLVLQIGKHDNNFEIVEPQQFLTYGKRFVIVYIKDQFLPYKKYISKSYNPFHICWCDALKGAQQSHRYESRYVLTYNTSGRYLINLSIRDRNRDGYPYTEKKEQDVYRKLHVCQSCLYQLNWKNFRQYCGPSPEWWKGGNPSMRKKIVDEFDIDEFLRFSQNSRQNSVEQNSLYSHSVWGTAASSTPKEYRLTPKFKEDLKRMFGYHCEMCHKLFDEKDLFIHHINHNEGDNRRDNLLVVCQSCHSKIHKLEGGFTKHSNTEKSITQNDFIESVINLEKAYAYDTKIDRNKLNVKDIKKDFNINFNDDISKDEYSASDLPILAKIGYGKSYYHYANIIREKEEYYNLENTSSNDWYNKAIDYYEQNIKKYIEERKYRSFTFDREKFSFLSGMINYGCLKKIDPLHVQVQDDNIEQILGDIEIKELGISYIKILIQRYNLCLQNGGDYLDLLYKNYPFKQEILHRIDDIYIGSNTDLSRNCFDGIYMAIPSYITYMKDISMIFVPDFLSALMEYYYIELNFDININIEKMKMEPIYNKKNQYIIELKKPAFYHYEHYENKPSIFAPSVRKCLLDNGRGIITIHIRTQRI